MQLKIGITTMLAAWILSAPFFAMPELAQGKAFASEREYPPYGQTHLDWYTEHSLSGSAEAQFKLGQLYYQGNLIPRDRNKALYWYRKAAEQGQPDAQQILGYLSFRKIGVDGSKSPQDRAEALKWLSKAANQGHARAEYLLGFWAQTEGRYPDALGWFRKAAAHGDSTAMLLLAGALASGRLERHTFLKNDIEAAKWYTRLAEQGSSLGMRAIGLMYMAGRGVPHDKIMAYTWLSRAVMKDSSVAPKLEELIPLMTPEEIDEGDRRLGRSK